MKKSVLLFCAFFLMTSLCFAETIYLKNGRVIKGTIVQKTDDQITVNSNGIELTYFADEVERIEGGAAATPQPLAEPALSEVPKTPEPVVSKLSTTEANTDTDKRGLILKYMEASGARANMQKTFADIINSADLEKKAVLEQVLSLDDIIDQLVPVYEKYFSAQDLRELIAFYESPTAKKLSEVQPLLLKDVMETSRQYFEGKIE